jgi:hypothetical protein
MTVSNPNSSLKPMLAAFLIALPAVACADASLTFGSGPNDYRSYAFKANVGIFKLPLQIDLDHFQANSTGGSNMKESGAGLTWNATELLSANYRRSSIDDGTFDVAGNEGGLSFGLDTLWESDLHTSLNVGYGTFDYTPTTIARAKLASKLTLSQNRKSIGLSQDITPTFSLYATHDQYEYERYQTFNGDLRVLAIALFRRTVNASKVAFTLVSFPDKTNTLGMSWKPQDKLTLDLSSGKTNTVLEQQLKNTRLSADLQLNEKFSLIAAVTRSNSSAVTTAAGRVLQPETSNTYTELSAGWAF